MSFAQLIKNSLKFVDAMPKHTSITLRCIYHNNNIFMLMPFLSSSSQSSTSCHNTIPYRPTLTCTLCVVFLDLEIGSSTETARSTTTATLSLLRWIDSIFQGIDFLKIKESSWRIWARIRFPMIWAELCEERWIC